LFPTATATVISFAAVVSGVRLHPSRIRSEVGQYVPGRLQVEAASERRRCGSHSSRDLAKTSIIIVPFGSGTCLFHLSMSFQPIGGATSFRCGVLVITNHPPVSQVLGLPLSSLMLIKPRPAFQGVAILITNALAWKAWHWQLT
jgi:hypothetical protein